MWFQSLRMLLVMTLLTGIIYPVGITALSQIFFREKANGSVLTKEDQVVGSSLMAQKFEKDIYFWPRPSAVDYNPLPSGGTNLGPVSAALKKQVEDRRAKFAKANAVSVESVPKDALFASGSGLDPHIGLENARRQLPRVTSARHLDERQKSELARLLENSLEKRQFGVLGEERINVLLLNVALDKMR